MTILDQIIERYPDDDFLMANGFSHCILGVAEDFNRPPRLIYSVKKVLEVLEKCGLKPEETREFFDFNIKGAFVGEKTPVWCEDEFDVE